MFKCFSRIIWRINIDTLYLPRILLFQCLQCQQIIPVDEHIFRVRVAVAETGVFDEEAGFGVEGLVFVEPGEF